MKENTEINNNEKSTNICTKKIAVYTSSFNPPNINHFVEITKLLSENDEVYVFPIISVQNKFYQKTPSYKKRIKMLSLFLSEFFPKITNELVLVDTKEEMAHKSSRINICDSLIFMKNSLEDLGDIKLIIHFEDTLEENDIIKSRDKSAIINSNIITQYDGNKKASEVRKILNKGLTTLNKENTDTLNYFLGHRLTKSLLGENLYKIKKIKLEPKNSNKIIMK